LYFMAGPARDLLYSMKKEEKIEAKIKWKE
jgi:hypothetical protein